MDNPFENVGLNKKNNTRGEQYIGERKKQKCV